MGIIEQEKMKIILEKLLYHSVTLFPIYDKAGPLKKKEQKVRISLSRDKGTK